MNIYYQPVAFAMASSTTDNLFDRPSATELESELRGVKRMLTIAGIFAAVGYVLLLFALSQEFTTVADVFTEDTMKMWLKLGGVGHILVGIFIALVAIVRVLRIVPDRLSHLLD